MLAETSRPFALAMRLLLVAATSFAAISCVQSCNDKPNEGETESPDTRHWVQSKVDLCASWSPDGKKIIYMREPADAGKDTSWQFGAFIRDMESGKDTCIWPNVKFHGFSWSPSGDTLAVDQDGQLYIYEFATESIRRVTFRNRSFSPSWSRCGDKIVFFDRFNYVGMQFYDFGLDSVMAVSGRDQAWTGDWMPDCSTVVALDSARYSRGKIFAFNLYTNALRLITDKKGYKNDLAVAPDGETVVFTVDYNLWLVSTSGGGPIQLTTEGGGYPDWSPDGQWIVYTKDNKYNGYLWLMRPDGSEKHQLTF